MLMMLMLLMSSFAGLIPLSNPHQGVDTPAPLPLLLDPLLPVPCLSIFPLISLCLSFKSFQRLYCRRPRIRVLWRGS